MELHHLLEDIRRFDAYGCEINTIPVTALFERYRQLGFLYPAKAQRLAPYLATIEENWRRALRAGEELLWVVTHDEPGTGFATTCTWRSTNAGWVAQHLVSTHPFASARVLLAAQAKVIQEGKMKASQNWFRPSNQYASQVFGSMVGAIGEDDASVRTYTYLAARPINLQVATDTLRLVPCHPSTDSGLYDLAVKARGKVYAEAEELDQDDLSLTKLNDLYQRVGLSRTRHIWLVYHRHHERPIAAALAYRGPLGLNFSMIENRCDLLFDPSLEEAEIGPAAALLLQAAWQAYTDFAPGFIPVTIENRAAGILLQFGATVIQTYSQGIWLQPGFFAWYRHVASLYRQRLARPRGRYRAV